MTRFSEFIIDKITNSIEDRISGRSFETEVVAISPEEIKSIHKKDGWLFNWKKEFKENNDRRIYKLVIKGDRKIQGLLSIEPKPDQQFIEMHLIESAPHNYGSNKKYFGVAGNLVAFACKTSFDMGFDGIVAFRAKTALMDHYSVTLGAESVFRERMVIFTPAAKKLVNSYYRNYIDE